MAATYRSVGVLGHDRGDLTEAATQYRRSLDISERLGDQAETAVAYDNLGILAAVRGDPTEAATQFLAFDRGHIEEAIGLHGRALLIRTGWGFRRPRST